MRTTSSTHPSRDAAAGEEAGALRSLLRVAGLVAIDFGAAIAEEASDVVRADPDVDRFCLGEAASMTDEPAVAAVRKDA